MFQSGHVNEYKLIYMDILKGKSRKQQVLLLFLLIVKKNRHIGQHVPRIYDAIVFCDLNVCCTKCGYYCPIGKLRFTT